MLFNHNTGKALNSSNSSGTELEYITTSNVYWDRFELDGLKKMGFNTNEIDKYTVTKGDLLVCEGGDIGRAAIWNFDEPIRIQNHLHRLRPYDKIISQFYYYIFYLYKLNGKIKGNGIGLQGLSSNALHSILVPVAPINQQRMIVQKIEEIFTLIDFLDEQKLDLTECIETIKSKILDLAIRGKLVPQDPNDEPASVLLKRIRAEKEELIKQGKIKRDKKESVIFKGEDNSYYQDLPNGWSVCKLCEISYFERGITFPASAKEAAPTGRNIACARTANVQDSFDISNLIYVDKSFMKDNPDKLLKVNDIIVSTANSLELVGKSCIVEKLLEKMTFGGFVTVIRGIGINHKYIHMCLKNKFLKGEFSYKSTQTTNIANISTKDLAETLIYLPPLAEQRRIVNTIEALFAQIDKISEQIS